MKNFERNLFILVKQCGELNLSESEFSFPKIVPLAHLSCNIYDVGKVPILKTPHFKYFSGKNMLEKFFPNVHNDLSLYFKNKYSENSESKIQAAMNLLNDDGVYLKDEYKCSPILVDSENCILDGNLRAARLLSLGATHAVVNELRPNKLNYARKSLDFDKYALKVSAEMAKYLAETKASFKEWYSPLELGPYKLPKITYPQFDEVWDFDDGEGIRNWNTTIKHVVPNVSGKTVLDIGSNIGLFSLELERMGASVCGVDRGPKIVQANNHLLGAQSVPNQAYSIRNIYESYYGERFTKVAFAELDLMDFDFSDTRCDLFFSCRVLYHLGKSRMEDIIDSISKNIPEIILQSNEGHSGKLGLISSMAFHKKLLIKCGYKIKNEWAPVGCYHPIVYATK
jgi:SAM-dependent methyltransferase